MGRGIEKNVSTEGKIKEAALKLFTKKGYKAVTIREIAIEAGVGYTLVNYYFRSKENLFDMIMLENLRLFIPGVLDTVNDPATTLQKKIEILVGNYIDMLIKNPNIPIFVLNEVNASPKKLISKLKINREMHENLYMVKQWKEMATAKKIMLNPLHIVMNVLSMTIFPFVSGPILRNRAEISMDEFNKLMEERKKLIPMWLNAIIKAS